LIQIKRRIESRTVLLLRERGRGAEQSSAGFTLIELIVVIFLLGILTAVALPKFIDLGREARIAKLQGARGAVGSAALLANSVSVSKGLAPAASVAMGGSTVTMAMSYPTPNVAGIVLAAGFSSRA